MKTGDLQEARNRIAGFRIQWPEKAEAFYSIEAKILLAAERPQDAMELYDAALVQFPESINLLYERAV